MSQPPFLSLSHSTGLPQASGDIELVTLGTGERLKRTTLPNTAPKKPVRHSPMNTPLMERKWEEVKTEEDIETETPMEAEVGVEAESEHASMYMNLNADGEVDSAEGELDEPMREGEEGDVKEKRKPREEAKDRRTSRQQKREREKLERDREKQEGRERKQRERKEEKERKVKEKSKSPPPPDSNIPLLPERERTAVSGTEDDTKLTNGTNEEEEVEDESATRASEVLVTKYPNQVTACGQPINVMFNTTSAGEGVLTAVCKGTKVAVVETSVKEEANRQYCVQFTPGVADVYMLSVRWGDKDVTGSPFLINLNLLQPAPISEEEKEEDKGGSVAAKSTEEPKESGEGEEKEAVKEQVKREVRENGELQEQAKRNSREKREESPLIVVSEDPFDMAHQASRLLGKYATYLVFMKL